MSLVGQQVWGWWLRCTVGRDQELGGGELQQLRGELRQLAERATTLDPEHCPAEQVCHIIA